MGFMKRRRFHCAAVAIPLLLPALAGAQAGTTQAPRVLPAPTLVSAERLVAGPASAQILQLKSGDLLVPRSGGQLSLYDSAFNLRRVVREKALPPSNPLLAGIASVDLISRRLVAYLGDSVLVVERSNVAMTMLAPAGDSARVITFGRAPDVSAFSNSAAARVDAGGRFVYMPAPSIPLASTPGRDGATMTTRDSTPLLAYHQQTRRLDTLAFLRVASSLAIIRTSPAAVLYGRSAARSSRQEDMWSVLSDGTVLILRASVCQVDVVTATGLRRVSQALPCERQTLSPAEKDSLIAARQARGQSMSPSSPPGSRAIANALAVPDVMPAYTGAMPDRDGNLWIRQGRYDPSYSAVYDVIDRTGALVDVVAIPRAYQLIGFGVGSVFVALTDSYEADKGMLIGRIPK
jgi:hypothetical protein